MQVHDLDIHKDDRGYFSELFRYDGYVQDNISFSKFGVIRGLHYQVKSPQSKIVFVLHGRIFDVSVDLYTGEIESAEVKKNQFVLISQRCAHGFSVLSKTALVFYKCSRIYYPGYERGIIYNDKDLKINWHVKNPILSEKDKKWPRFRNINMEELEYA
jgi:dTDP-4-dehydrorhamnose 3,5-epimerase